MEEKLKIKERIYFVPEVCNYNPSVDISPVAPNDSVDLQQAFLTGSIPNNVVLGEDSYDGNEDPKSIMGRPANEFEAIHMMETLKGLKKSSESDNEPKN